MHIATPDIIVAGSAVSILDDVAPGVGDFLDELLRDLADAATATDDSKNGMRWFSAFTRAVVDHRGRQVVGQTKLIEKVRKSYKRILKFEEVLRLAELCRIDPTRLVASAYSTTSFNLNHAALAYLGTTGRYEILTTNFDTGIELAGNLEVELGHPLGMAERRPGRHAVVKLHGCAREGSIVATTSTLLTAEGARRYDFIERLCEGRMVRLFGYSGRGDVDIAPHLGAAAADSVMLWFNHQHAVPPFKDAEFKLSNLNERDPRKNSLLQLAVAEGWIIPDGLRGSKWDPQPLRDEIKKIPTDQAARLLAQIWGSVDSELHLISYALDYTLCDDGVARSRFVSWYVENGTDLPPSRTADHTEVLRMARAARTIDPIFATRWEAFGHWRMGDHELAQGMVAGILAKGQGKARDRLHSASLGLAIVCESLWCAQPNARNSVLRINEQFLQRCEYEASKLIEHDGLDLETQMVARRNLLHMKIWRTALLVPRSEEELSRLHGLLGSLSEQLADLQLWEGHRYTELFYRGLQRRLRIRVSSTIRTANGPAHLRSIQLKKSIAYLFPLQTMGPAVCEFLERTIMPLLNFVQRRAWRKLVRTLIADLQSIERSKENACSASEHSDLWDPVAK